MHHYNEQYSMNYTFHINLEKIHLKGFNRMKLANRSKRNDKKKER